MLAQKMVVFEWVMSPSPRATPAVPGKPVAAYWGTRDVLPTDICLPQSAIHQKSSFCWLSIEDGQVGGYRGGSHHKLRKRVQ